jgi:hypothetical protein
MTYRIIIDGEFLDKERSSVYAAQLTAEALMGDVETHNIYIIDSSTMGIVSQGEITVYVDWDPVGKSSDKAPEPEPEPEPEPAADPLQDSGFTSGRLSAEGATGRYGERLVVVVWDNGGMMQAAYKTLVGMYGWDAGDADEAAEKMFEDGWKVVIPATAKQMGGTAYRPDLAPDFDTRHSMAVVHADEGGKS